MAIAVTPTRIEAAVKDGDMLPPITIINNGNEDITVRAYVGPGGHDLDGTPILLAGPEYLTAGPDCLVAGSGQTCTYGIELLQDKVRISPGGSEKVLARVRVPDGAKGGLYPVIYLECAAPGTVGGAGISPISRVAVLTLLRLPGAIPGGLKARSLSVTQDSPGQPLSLELTVENTGNVHYYAMAFARIESQSGEIVATFPMQAAIVLPGCARRITGSWEPGAAPPGIYRASAQLLPGNSEDQLAWHAEDMEDGRVVTTEFVMPAAAQLALKEHNSRSQGIDPEGSE
ncbi:MAG TPA: hypothetical protein GX506_12385 [Firmicutes bacterium]|nr:hypothetical protein [Bacillota bacterium]